jgi:hypothetical protein
MMPAIIFGVSANELYLLANDIMFSAVAGFNHQVKAEARKSCPPLSPPIAAEYLREAESIAAEVKCIHLTMLRMMCRQQNWHF